MGVKRLGSGLEIDLEFRGWIQWKDQGVHGGFRLGFGIEVGAESKDPG